MFDQLCANVAYVCVDRGVNAADGFVCCMKFYGNGPLNHELPQMKEEKKEYIQFRKMRSQRE